MARPLNLADVLEVMADSVPDRLAFVTEHGQSTYSQLDERSTRLANHLVAQGVKPGDHIAVHAGNCVEWAESLYAAMKARAVAINVNFRYVHNELKYIYDNCQAVAAIVGPEYVEAVRRVNDELGTLKHTLVIGEDYEAALAAASSDRLDNGRSGDDHYIVYTGGTTGMPKGVIWRQEDLLMGALNELRYRAPIESIEKLGEEAAANENPLKLMVCGPLMHGGSQWSMGNAHVGGSVFTLYCGTKFDPEKVLDLTVSSGTNSLALLGDAMARPVLDALEANPERWDLSQLFALSNAAAAMSTGTRDQIKRVLPNVFIRDNYGASESGAAAARMDDGQEREAPRFDVTDDLMVMRPDGTSCEVGEVGMLARSGWIPLGYLGDPEKTAATFKVVDGKRWVIPGDFARLEPDGTVSMLGRGSVCINTGGEKVHPEEVESVLKQHPAVFDAAVAGTAHERWGQQVTALVHLREGTTADAAELDRHCRELLAGYKVPKQFFIVDEVPRTPVSKVDYKAVKELATTLAGDSEDSHV